MDAVDALIPELREIRHDLHRHPELGFEEHRTQGLVRSWLERHGYAPKDSAQTGLIADLHPDRYGKDRTIALRADLDCLPMNETTDIPWKSTHVGRAHKCGHDGHTAILLGVAALLAERRDAIDGNVRLLFQPAEEGVRGGGAKVMVAEGALQHVEEVYGLHNWPGHPKGEVRVKAGPMLAQVHRLDIQVTGVGGHGSQPQSCRDPIVAAAHLVGALQTAVSRGLGYRGGAVVSVCQFQAGSADNVIPDLAKLTGTIRTFESGVTERVLARIGELAEGTATMFGVKVDLDLKAGYPALINDAECAAAVRRVGGTVVGPAHVSEADLPIAGGEDFAYMAQATRAAYFVLGAGKPGENTPICHHPDFDFDDDLIPTGVKMFLGLVEDRLGAGATKSQPPGPR